MLLHLAQVNIATLVKPIDHPDTAPFADALAAVNALAESSPGFVWRLQTEEGNATAIQAFPNPLTIPNLTVRPPLSRVCTFARIPIESAQTRRR